jgi:TolB-like protein/tetratricopeptide (TPR) repeat protein
VKLFKDLLERHVARYFVAYCAAGWAALEAVDQLRENGVVSGWVWRAAFALFLSGLPGAVIVSWFHGAKGKQVMPTIEKWLLAGVAVFAVAVTVSVARSGMEPSTGTTAELEPWQDPSHVAVLYFDARGGGDADFLASGLTEGLIDELSAVEGIHVVSKNGSQLFRDSAAPPDSIGKTLEVGTLVGGTVAQAGDRVQVDVNVTNAATGKQYATTRLQRPRTEIFELTDTLAKTVALFLRQQIGVEVGDVRLRAGTNVPGAWELVQQAANAEREAKELAASGDLPGAERAYQRADSTLAEAEGLDPSWVEPIVRRGWMDYRQARLSGLDRSENERWTGKGLEEADRALAKDSTNAGALDLKATLQYWRYLLNLGETQEEANRLFREAEAGFRAATDADPNRASALTSLSHLLLNKGEVIQAKLAAQRAYEADPFLENANLTLWRLVSASWDLNLASETERYCNEGLRRFPDDYRFHQCRLMLQALPRSAPPDIDEAWQRLDEFAELSPPQVRDVNRHRGMMYVAMALAQAGLPDSARAVAVRGRVSAEEDPLRELDFFEALARIAMGDYDEATKRMGFYLAANPGQLDAYRQEISNGEVDWYLRDLVDFPGFRSLLGIR